MAEYELQSCLIKPNLIFIPSDECYRKTGSINFPILLKCTRIFFAIALPFWYYLRNSEETSVILWNSALFFLWQYLLHARVTSSRLARRFMDRTRGLLVIHSSLRAIQSQCVREIAGGGGTGVKTLYVSGGRMFHDRSLSQLLRLRRIWFSFQWFYGNPLHGSTIIMYWFSRHYLPLRVFQWSTTTCLPR